MSRLQDMSWANDGVLTHECGNTIITVQAWGTNGLRVRIKQRGVEQTSDWALDIPQQEKGIIDIGEKTVIMRNGDILLELSDIYTQAGYMKFFSTVGGEKRLMLAEKNWVVGAHNPGTHILIDAGDGLYKASLIFEANEGEKLFGMGGNDADSLDLKGRVIDLYQCHVKSTVPFVVSSRGYGFLWNNPALGRVEFSTDRTKWVAENTKQIDFYITVGDSYAEILKNYSDVTGYAPELPYFASGFFQCKLRYSSQEQLLGVLREFKKRKLPLSVLIIDYYHWKKFGDWCLDEDKWPDIPAMVKECDEAGVKLMISPWTLLQPGAKDYDTFINNHLCVRNQFGNERFHNAGIDDVVQYDPTSPEAGKIIWERWKENYYDKGIKLYWLDPCDEFTNVNNNHNPYFHVGSAKECHSIYVTSHQKNIYEGMKKAGENEIIFIARNAWAGSQRYGVCPAPHDIMSSFEHMRRYLVAGLNTMMSGIPWWNCDIGGFVTFDNFNHTSEFYEMMIRWYQYGVFMPIFRTHGRRDNNEPWTVGGNTYPYLRESLFMRERLRDYIMEQMQLASSKGIPPMRPLFFDFSNDEETYNVNDAFLFGADIYVAPILEYNARVRKVYLPKGTRWIDVWSGQVLEGGQYITADAPLEHIPVYVKEGRNDLVEIIKAKAPEESA